jgi:hypothetical protein
VREDLCKIRPLAGSSSSVKRVSNEGSRNPVFGPESAGWACILGECQVEDYHRFEEELDRERQTRAMESMARSQARMAEPQATPYVIPTPIQVQIVPQ